jgi:hypothetical protein
MGWGLSPTLDTPIRHYQGTAVYVTCAVVEVSPWFHSTLHMTQATPYFWCGDSKLASFSQDSPLTRGLNPRLYSQRAVNGLAHEAVKP